MSTFSSTREGQAAQEALMNSRLSIIGHNLVHKNSTFVYALDKTRSFKLMILENGNWIRSQAKPDLPLATIKNLQGRSQDFQNQIRVQQGGGSTYTVIEHTVLAFVVTDAQFRILMCISSEINVLRLLDGRVLYLALWGWSPVPPKPVQSKRPSSSRP